MWAGWWQRQINPEGTKVAETKRNYGVVGKQREALPFKAMWIHKVLFFQVVMWDSSLYAVNMIG